MSTFNSYRHRSAASHPVSGGRENNTPPEVCNQNCLGPRLCTALLRGDNQEAAALLRSGAAPDFKGEPDGWTPLIYAIYYDNPDGRQLLFEFGADPECADYSGRTPLMFAAMNGNLSLLTELLTRGANAKISDNSGRTACDYAMLYRHRNCLAELLRIVSESQQEER